MWLWLIAIIPMIIKLKRKEGLYLSEKVKRNVSVVKDINGNNIVLINDIIFKGRQAIKWDDVEEYLRQYVGEIYTIADNREIVYIGNDLPDEYAHSEYTTILRGANAKAKANAAQGIPELIEISQGMVFKENKKEKHSKDAKYGWYRYESRFALPIILENGEVERYNVFHVAMVFRHSEDGKKYLYDIMNIKKETGNLFRSEDVTQSKTHFLNDRIPDISIDVNENK